jgi:hypothetical protein
MQRARKFQVVECQGANELMENIQFVRGEVGWSVKAGAKSKTDKSTMNLDKRVNFEKLLAKNLDVSKLPKTIRLF